MKKIFIIIALVLATTGVVKAQEGSGRTPQYYTMGWNMSTLLGGASDFIPAFSPSGFAFSGQVYLTKQFALGFGVAWNNYYDLTDRKSWKLDNNTSVTAEQYRYMTSVPLQIGGYWNFMPESIVQPYVGVGLGMYYSQQSIYVSDWDFWDSQYGFHVSPEIGAFIKFGENSIWGANVAVAYQYNTNSFDFQTVGKIEGIQALSINLGISCMLR